MKEYGFLSTASKEQYMNNEPLIDIQPIKQQVDQAAMRFAQILAENQNLTEENERLRKLVDAHEDPANWHPITDLMVDEAAKRKIAALEAEVRRLREALSDKKDVLEAEAHALRGENTRLREALSFYAEEKHWESSTESLKGGRLYLDDGCCFECCGGCTEANEDRGAKARAALGQQAEGETP